MSGRKSLVASSVRWFEGGHTGITWNTTIERQYLVSDGQGKECVYAFDKEKTKKIASVDDDHCESFVITGEHFRPTLNTDVSLLKMFSRETGFGGRHCYHYTRCRSLLDHSLINRGENR